MKKISKLNKVLATTVALSAATVVSTSGVQAAGTDYKDMNKAGDWAVEAIKILQEEGIMTGDDQGQFRPLDNISRAEIAVVIARTLKLDTPEVATSSFSDVPAGSWASKYVEAVKNAGLMNGYGDGTFGPSKLISREELAVVFVKSQNVDPTGKGETLEIADKDSISGWAKDYVAVALQMGLMKGDGVNFNPKAVATRQEVAVAASNNLTIIKKNTSNSDPVAVI